MSSNVTYTISLIACRRLCCLELLHAGATFLALFVERLVTSTFNASVLRLTWQREQPQAGAHENVLQSLVHYGAPGVFLLNLIPYWYCSSLALRESCSIMQPNTTVDNLKSFNELNNNPGLYFKMGRLYLELANSNKLTARSPQFSQIPTIIWDFLLRIT